jgi:hypothetical protein
MMDTQSERHDRELRNELEGLRKRVHDLEAAHAGRMCTVNSPDRRRFSKSLAAGLIPLAVLVVVTAGLLYGQSAVDALFIDQQGNIGIGTTMPRAKLHVDKGTATGDGIVISGAKDARIKIGEGQPTVWSWANGSETPGDLSLIEEGHSSTRIYAKPGGNIGFGTKSPVASLDIQQANRTGSHPASVKGLYVTGDFSPDNGVEFRHSNGSQGIGFGYNTIYATGGNGDQDLNLKPRGNGKVNVYGLLNATLLGRYQRDDRPETTYQVAPRYHLSLTAASYQGRTKTIPQDTLVALCGDADGCEIRLGMTRWDNSAETETASHLFLFYYSNENGHWRSRTTDGETLGIDGDGKTQHVKDAWGTCFFTDGNYDGYQDKGDPGRGMQLLVWNGFNGPNRTCELTIID